MYRISEPHTAAEGEAPLDVKLKASGAIARAEHSTLLQGAAAMAEPSSAGVGLLLAKLLPAGIGAALMIAVDTPQTKREWFVRIFVAFACSFTFYGFTFDLLRSLSWFSFLDRANEDHQFAVRALLGAGGWFLLGGASQMLKRFRADPASAVRELRP